MFAPLAVADPGTPWDKKIAGAGRFKVLSQFGNAAVFDKETGRVWDQSPDTNTRSWVNALSHCYQRLVGGRKGWRPPTIEELASLVDSSVPGSPKLPVGHPFSNVPGASFLFWSITAHGEHGFTGNAWFVNFFAGAVDFGAKSLSVSVSSWCVRGGHGYDGGQ